MLRIGPPNVQRMAEKGDIKGLIGALGYEKDASVRIAAAESLGQIQDAQAIAALLRALGDSAAPVRQAAIEALVDAGGQDAIEPIIGMLSDSDEDVASTAARMLGSSGDVRAVTPLLNAARGARSTLALGASDALVALGDPAARAIAPLLVSGDEAEKDLARALIKRLGERALPALRDMMRTENRDLRWRAIEAVAQIPGEEPLQMLAQAMEDSDYYVRNAAQTGLVGRGEEAVPQLTSLLHHDSLSLRTMAVEALGRIGSPGVAEPLIALLTDAPSSVARVAAVVLGKIGDPRASAPLATLLAPVNDVMTRREVAQALARIHDPSSAEALIWATGDSDDVVRRHAAEGLAAMGWEPGNDELGARYWASQKRWERCVQIGGPAADVLLHLLPDTLYAEARMVRTAIERIGAAAVPALIAGLASPDKRVRVEAATIAARIGDDEVVLPALVRALQDPDRDVRAAAAAAMADMDGDEVVPSLLQALTDWERNVQDAAAQSLATARADVMEELTAMLSAPDWHTQRGAILALGHSQQPEAVSLLVPYLSATELNLRNAAVDALTNLGALSLDALTEALHADDAQTRLTAITTVVAIKDKRGLEPLLNMLWDGDPVIRKAAYQGLRDIGTGETLAIDLISRLRSLYLMVCSEEELAPDEWTDLANNALKDLVDNVPALQFVHAVVLSDLSRLHQSFHRFTRGERTYSNLVATFRTWIEEQGVTPVDWERRFFHRELLDPETIDGVDVVAFYYHDT